jgi:hypothetical protein
MGCPFTLATRGFSGVGMVVGVGLDVSTAVGISGVKVGSVISMGGASAGPHPTRPPKITAMARAPMLEANSPPPRVAALKRHQAKIRVPAHARGPNLLTICSPWAFQYYTFIMRFVNPGLGGVLYLTTLS